MMRFFRVYGLSCVVTLTILYLCIARTLPVENVPKFEGIDKVVHFLMYVGLAGALCFTITDREFRFLRLECMRGQSCSLSCMVVS